MKKCFVLLVLAVIAVGGVFAQRVGDTVQVAGQTYTILTISGDTIVLQRGGQPQGGVTGDTTVPSQLNGVWGHRSNLANRFVNGARFQISGTSAVLTDISEVQANNNIFRDALVKGFVKVGDPILRNIRATGATTYSCEVLFIEATGTTANSASWKPGTITYATTSGGRFTITVTGFGDIGNFNRR